jgi:REP element-mobilizing transposase RayT
VPRKPRVEVEGGIFHVWARGNDQRRIYLDDLDREIYLDILGHVSRTRSWYVLSYCLMDNHVHLVVETPGANLGDGMQFLHGLYAQDFNERHGRVGHLFQGRYGARLLDCDEALWGAIAYVVRNPVEAGLCRRPEDWPWSSHAATHAGRAPDWLGTQQLLRHFAEVGGDPLARYAELTAAS